MHNGEPLTWYYMAINFPPIYLLSTRLAPDELHCLESRIPSLTYNIHEAHIIVGKISKPERALFELRRHKLRIATPISTSTSRDLAAGPAKDAPSETAEMPRGAGGEAPSKRTKLGPAPASSSMTGGQHDVDLVKVVKLSWLEDCLESGELMPTDGYLLFQGQGTRLLPTLPSAGKTAPSRDDGAKILQRAAEDRGLHAPDAEASPQRRKRGLGAEPPPKQQQSAPPSLVRETTSEHEVPLKDIPDYLHTTYSCQRPTPVNPPNPAFIQELKEIRTLRLLRGDEIGVRAYSTSIATLSAYPHAIQTSQEIERLPGCGAKIAELYAQWMTTGHTTETTEANADEKTSILMLFYGIWGVGDTTAREFYRKGWRDLDDVVEYGWQTLSRVQQIGVKFYEEFQLKIPRDEVEEIADAILAHAQEMDSRYEMTVVGGYRRGKLQSGDVDVVLSHRDEAKTLHLVEKIVSVLEGSHLITHTLSLWTRNSERNQQPLAMHGERAARGSGFDTLDKAMVVWQDTGRHGQDAPHRRVDIIVSPWKTVGCALLGWSGGTTFQRDLRRYCKQEKGLKFDSSGIRSRADGRWVDFEGCGSSMDGGPGPKMDPAPQPNLAPDMESAEKRVFAGLGLPWRHPTERCTG